MWRDPVGRSMASQFFRRALIDGSTLDGRPYNIAEALAAMCPFACALHMTRGGLLNLDFCILPSKVASDTPFLGNLWTNVAETLVDLWPRICQFQPILSTNGWEKVFSMQLMKAKYWNLDFNYNLCTRDEFIKPQMHISYCNRKVDRWQKWYMHIM